MKMLVPNILKSVPLTNHQPEQTDEEFIMKIEIQQISTGMVVTFDNILEAARFFGTNVAGVMKYAKNNGMQIRNVVFTSKDKTRELATN